MIQFYALWFYQGELYDHRFDDFRYYLRGLDFVRAFIPKTENRKNYLRYLLAYLPFRGYFYARFRRNLSKRSMARSYRLFRRKSVENFSTFYFHYATFRVLGRSGFLSLLSGIRHKKSKKEPTLALFNSLYRRIYIDGVYFQRYSYLNFYALYLLFRKTLQNQPERVGNLHM